MQSKQEERRVLHSSLIRNCQKSIWTRIWTAILNLDFRLHVKVNTNLHEEKSRQALPLRTVLILRIKRGKNHRKVMMTGDHESHDYKLSLIWQFWSYLDVQRCWHHFNLEPSNSTLGCHCRVSTIIENIRGKRHKLKHRKSHKNMRQNFTLRVTKHQNRLHVEVLESPSLDILKIHLHTIPYTML